MAESTAESNADTLRRELKTKLSAILHDGGSKDRGDSGGNFGVLKEIDDAIRILTSLRKLESSSSPSTSVEVPKEFVCKLSHKIMIEPVVIASGQTFEKRYITEWLTHHRTCPETGEVLSHCVLTPNQLANELISQWCRLNKFDRPEPSEEIAIELFTDDIDSLLQRVSSPSSVADQLEAAEELRGRTKKFRNVRVFFVAQLQDSVTRLLTPLIVLGEAVDSNPQLQEHIIATLFNISSPDKNKTVIVENPHVIPLLTKSLKQGTSEAQRNSAATLMSLSVIDPNKVIIGNSGALNALIELIKEGDYLATKDAASAVYNICLKREIGEKAILAGLVPVLTNKINAGSNVDELVTVLALISAHRRAGEEIEKLGFIHRLFMILREPSSQVTGENALGTVYNMCDKNRSGYILKMVGEEEKQHGTFSKLARQGTDRSMRKAVLVLKESQRFKAGKEPMRR